MAKNKFKKLMEMIESQKDYVTDHPKFETLDAIADVETGGGKYMKHKPVHGGMHKGSSAIGKYGIMPSTIKETEKSLSKLSDEQLRKKISQDPELEERVASKYYDRLREQLGTNKPEAIGYGWLQGITGAKKAIKSGKDIDKHWHVKKIKNAFADPLDVPEKDLDRMPASIDDEMDNTEEMSLGDRISDLATTFFEKIDPTMMRERAMEEKEEMKLSKQKQDEFEELKKRQKERAELTRKKILNSKD